MYYALINMSNSCEAITDLAWGSLKDIKRKLVNNAEFLIEEEGMSIEELEDEEDLDFSDYLRFKRRRKITPEIISDFYFELSDMTTEVGCVVEGYEKLVHEFEKYAEKKPLLNHWRMVPCIDETEENLEKLSEELRTLPGTTAQKLVFFFRK